MNENENLKASDDADEDLEDGEIESDDENDTNSSAVINDSDTKGKSEKNKSNSAGENLCSPEKSNKNRGKSPPSSFDSGEKKSKKLAQNFDDDDFAGNIENAIAAVLKKDGIEPLPPPKIEKRFDGYDSPFAEELQTPRHKGKKRKRRDNDDVKKKKKNKRDEAKQDGNEEIDDYEMLCIRGGSPPSQPKFEDHSNNMPSYSSSQQYPQTYYESDDSGSSYNSWDSTEFRKEKRHNKHKGKDRKPHKNRDGMGREKRRHRNDSEGDDYKQEKSMGQRRMELCKFYLMECCAKREKCLYMHGDFPCKYYYLGMECVYKNACKFSHGEPLTDELKSILLKHIETAPKEILGNFRRISRDNALVLLSQTHAKLCAERGMDNVYSNNTLPPVEISDSPVNSPSHKPSNNNPFSNPNNNSGIPSLLDMVINPPNISPRKEDKERHKNEKPRKSRWCDNMNSPTSKNQKSPSSSLTQNSNLPSPTTRNVSTPTGASATSILSLQNLSGVLSPEQIEKLTAIGVETLEQINNLTVAQLNDLGLSISQIHEIQLNSLSIQKMGLINQNTTSNSTLATTNTITTTSTTTATLSSTNVIPEISSPTENEPPSDNLLNVQDIDMRCISTTFGSLKDEASKSEPSEGLGKLNVSEITAADAGIASPDPVPLSGKPFNEEKEKDDALFGQDQTKITYPSTEVVDFSQYLKDAHLDVDKDINLNNLLDKDDVLNEDEPALQIDESWCPSDDDTTKHDASLDSDGEPSMYWENTTDTDTKPETDSEKTTDTPKPVSYDPKSFLPQSMYSTTDFSKTSSDSIGDDNDSNSKDTEPKPPIVDVKFLSSISYDPKSFISPSVCNMIDASIKEEENKEEEEKKEIPPKIEPTLLDDVLYPKPITYDPQALLAPSVSKKVEVKTVLSDKWDEEEIITIPDDNQRESKIVEPVKEEEEVKKFNPFKQARKPNPFGNPTKFNPFRSDPRLNSYLHKRKSNDDESWDDNDAPKVSSPRPTESKEDDKKSEETIKKADEQSPLYNRTSIYDGSSIDNEEEGTSKKADKDMRMSLFLGQFSDSTTSDIDLRLPFKPAMVNYTPATEIDGSIGSHAPIPYKIVEVEIPKPDYSEIRRSIPVTDKTLDPRLRRIFCLKESIIIAAEGSEGENKAATETKVIPTGPRLDPRRKKDDSATVGGSTAMQVTSDSKSGQNVNLHVLLQKSEWYKNLSSKNKIMVNQQLAMLSSEIKKFNADQSPNKIFDLSVVATNPNLQQILENLGVYVDANANIKQVSDIEQDGESNAQANNMLGLLNMFDNTQNAGAHTIPMDLLMGARQMNQLNRHFMGGNPLPFGNMFNDVKPGLLGIAPGIQFNPNELGFMGNANFGKNDNMQGGMNSGGGHNSGGGGNRNRNNFRQGNNRNSGNDRWSGNNSGGRNNNNRRNFDNRRNNRDNRRDKQSNS